MYQPQAFREDRPRILHGLIRAEPLGMLISGGPDGLRADAMPFVLYSDDGPMGTLRAHVARANDHWRALREAPECLLVFQGPQAYVSPSWYASKRETGKVVPTWKYVVVQARGRASITHDAGWLRRQIDDLTSAREAHRVEPWAVSDAPDHFVAAQLRGIVGIEVAVTTIEGKWKVSQNRPEPDRRGVSEGLAAEGATIMAGLVAARDT